MPDTKRWTVVAYIRCSVAVDAVTEQEAFEKAPVIDVPGYLLDDVTLETDEEIQMTPNIDYHVPGTTVYAIEDVNSIGCGSAPAGTLGSIKRWENAGQVLVQYSNGASIVTFRNSLKVLGK